MTKKSGGILLYRIKNTGPEILLAHPGGPFFRNKDIGVWSIPKGIPETGESLERAALREFNEETGIHITRDPVPLGNVRQKGGKVVYAWCVEGDLPEQYQLRSNTFEMEWPPHSHKIQVFPEVDQLRFFEVNEAMVKMNPAQTAFIERLMIILKRS